MQPDLQYLLPAHLADAPNGEARAQQTAALVAERADAVDDEERRRLNAELVYINRGVAMAVAMRYRGRGIAWEDLCQTACEGLVKAVARFDAERSEDLLSFAVPTIRGEVQRHFRDHSWAVRPPRRVQELQQRVAHSSAELGQRLGREATVADLAEDLSLTEGEIGEALRAHECFHASSLDRPATVDSSVTIGDLVPDQAADQADFADAKISLAPLIRRLPERDRRILYLRFFEDMTQAEIGEDLGVSQMQVSRLLSRILGDLRREVA